MLAVSSILPLGSASEQGAMSADYLSMNDDLVSCRHVVWRNGVVVVQYSNAYFFIKECQGTSLAHDWWLKCFLLDLINNEIINAGKDRVARIKSVYYDWLIYIIIFVPLKRFFFLITTVIVIKKN